MKRALGLVLAAGLALSCESGESKPSKPAPAQPTASAAAPAPPPPTPKKSVTFASSDGAALAGDLYLATNATAPVAILVHRLNGDRSELAPLAERLATAPKRYTVLNFDLRGHGASKAPDKEKPNDTKSMAKDVEAAIDEALEVTHGKASGVVLVGTSLGAALVSEVAFSRPRVTALALVSPGAAISGHDLYRPYAEVRNLPTFIAGAKSDTVSQAPVEALEKMAMHGSVKRYEGSRHSAGFIAEEHPELWDDLVQFLMQSYELRPSPRKSLYKAEDDGKKKKGAH
jgi:alpha-beta hydrolase superfamily lysophospholipase